MAVSGALGGGGALSSKIGEVAMLAWGLACAALRPRRAFLATSASASSSPTFKDQHQQPTKEDHSAPHVGYGSGGRVEDVALRSGPEGVPFTVRALSHVSIAVPNAERAGEQLRVIFGAQVSEMIEIPERGVGVVTVHIGNACLMLMQPIRNAGDTPLNQKLMEFLDTKPHGGIHHLSFTVDKLCAAAQHLEAEGVPLLRHEETGEAIHTGVRSNPVLSLDPRGVAGMMCELEQVSYGRFTDRH